jgi:hypothetical protein
MAGSVASGQLLGALGKAQLANNLNQRARSANTGSLSVTPETERALRDACAEIHQMRRLLLRALGVAPESGSRRRS